jgi:hypothetical protein
MPGLDYDRLGFTVVAAVMMTLLTVVVIRQFANRGAESEDTEQ